MNYENSNVDLEILIVDDMLCVVYLNFYFILSFRKQHIM